MWLCVLSIICTIEHTHRHTQIQVYHGVHTQDFLRELFQHQQKSRRKKKTKQNRKKRGKERILRPVIQTNISLYLYMCCATQTHFAMTIIPEAGIIY